MIYSTRTKRFFLYTANSVNKRKENIIKEELELLEKEIYVASKILDYLKRNHDDKILIFRRQKKLKELKKTLLAAKHKYKDFINL